MCIDVSRKLWNFWNFWSCERSAKIRSRAVVFQNIRTVKLAKSEKVDIKKCKHIFQYHYCPDICLNLVRTGIDWDTKDALALWYLPIFVPQNNFWTPQTVQSSWLFSSVQ